jgi:hypothetical protein
MMTFEGEGKTHDAQHLWETLLPNSRDMSEIIRIIFDQ